MKVNSLRYIIGTAINQLLRDGKKVKSKSWQGSPAPFDFIEIINFSIKANMCSSPEGARDLCKPKLPWADIHFDERICGKPLNPPPSAELWSTRAKNYKSDGIKFSHSYPERLWAKDLAYGIRNPIGDLNDAIELLKKDPTTRQCYIPIWFPEDICAAGKGERVPCTIGYSIIIRDREIHLNYTIRSCDVIRHLANDLYLANRLCLHINKELGNKYRMGEIMFNCTSLHVFTNDLYTLRILEKDYE